MRRILSFALIAVVLAVVLPVQLRAQDLAAVSVDVHSLGQPIPAGFDRISTQYGHHPTDIFMGTVSSPIHLLGDACHPNRVFYQLLENLGRGTIPSVDGPLSGVGWNQREAPYPDACLWIVTADTVYGYMKAPAETGWGVLAGVNLAETLLPDRCSGGALYGSS